LKSTNFGKYEFWFKKISRGSTYLRPGNIFKSLLRVMKKNRGKRIDIELFENMFLEHFGVNFAIAFPCSFCPEFFC